MKSLILWALLSCGADPLPDGSLVFLENCNSFVEFSTGGKIGHVAIVIREGETPWIYEATPGRVRRVTLDEYCTELARLNDHRSRDNLVRTWLLRPKESYSAKELTAMRDYLQTQVGRRYSVKNYVVGQPGDGIHCAELAATTLNRSGRFALENCHCIHPTALFAAVGPLYQEQIELPLVAPTVQETWCQRQERRWNGWLSWCGWSFGEAMSYCW